VTFPVIDVVEFAGATLDGTEELALGLRELRRRLLPIRDWHRAPDNAVAPPGFVRRNDAQWLLVILNPAILVSDNLLAELIAVAGNGCSVPSDPRGFRAGVSLDYASRSGFDRFVARLESGPRAGPYDRREPWIYLAAAGAVAALDASHPGWSWHQVPALLGTKTSIAQRAFVHSYADYHLNTRAEMLRLLPDDIGSLLDIGGGYGNFARAFMAERGGKATLLEMNARAAAGARAQGLAVLEGSIEDLSLTNRYDAVALLDVLEHLADPLAALQKAHLVLQPKGALLLSVPNVGHWSVVWDLLEGRFDYQPVGILCNTHLRFFTRHGLEALLAEAGFRVERWVNVESLPPETFANFLNRNTNPGVMPDRESLATESFHVLARRA
jgi:2-polyprenyl-3-methyl-5-hydroxy-6-metoxy-1,4-benzoquinol methylase